MREILLILGVIFLVFTASVYAKGPKSGPHSMEDKPYKGAGIGREVSSEAKELKASNATKGEFGETVRERARDKKRIQIHKEMRQNQTKY